jgi:hypothetical protein
MVAMLQWLIANGRRWTKRSCMRVAALRGGGLSEQSDRHIGWCRADRR